MFKEFFQFVRLADKFFLKMNFEKKSFCQPPEADRIHTKQLRHSILARRFFCFVAWTLLH